MAMPMKTTFFVCMLVCLRSRCQRNQRSLTADILYTGCQNRTKFDTLMDLSLLNSGPYKTAELIDMPFGLRTWEGPGNHVLNGCPDHTPWEREILEESGDHLHYRDCQP